ncbi:MAG TPA: glycoside hydrolase family 43 protein [Kofleriaceae bacterium]|nr:glycoside hydrolase family 43 protein [Kofleriaceae bacterium]
MRRLMLIALGFAVGCGDDTIRDPVNFPDAGPPDASTCTTRITYASTWMKPDGHVGSTDVVDGVVEWDGTCTDDGANSYATLSNGWKPYFSGKQACAIALDYSECRVTGRCTTRITYASTWSHATTHPEQFDDVNARVFWDGACTNVASASYAKLSNAWQPYFTGNNACGMSFRWTNCGGLYSNPVLPMDCPDPFVAGSVLTCTSGNAPNHFPLYTSDNLITWQPIGHIFAGVRPAWAVSDFWAPEIHYVNGSYVAYFTARGTDGRLAIGVATSPSAIGPFTPRPTPLVHSTSVGLIDATYFSDGTTGYLAWKEDGNAQNQPTPIRASALAPDGLSLIGLTTQLITNDQTWEGNLVEAPEILVWQNSYYLFYSGNAYYDGRYAVGVAKASSPLGPYTKYANNPILATSNEWVGPGHCSITAGPQVSTDEELANDLYMVYHAWQAGHVNGPGDGRMVLVDQIQFGSDGWPHMFGAPSSASRPSP